ncbi:MAG: DMT family transporter [Myxococcota bacterium]
MTLDWNVITLVLLAALLHASWNAMTKSSADGLLTIWLITLFSGVLGAIGALFVPLPLAAAWPYLIVSAGIHLAYMLFLVRAYRLGDLSRVYPIARGLAPVVVALLAALFVGERPTIVQAGGLVACCAAIVSLAFADTELSQVSGRAVAAAVATGLMIATYTVIDGSGVRVAGEPLSYVAWNLLLDGIPLTLVVLFYRRSGQIRAFIRGNAGTSMAGGAMAATAYGIVLWAMAQGAMASVSSLRETSVVFAALIGTRLLGEPLGTRRMLAAVGVAIGLVVFQM